MCGIFGYIGPKQSTKQVFDGLKDLEYRGYDSWGIATLSKSNFIVQKDIGFLPDKINFVQADMALGHTRWATHGGVTRDNAHPHLSCDGRLAVVHNGIIENSVDLKKKLSSTHHFVSQTDTELIAHYLEEQIKSGKSLLKAVKKLISLIKGLNAFVVCDAVTHQMIAYRHGSPLILGSRGSSIYVSSDLPTLSRRVDKIYALADRDLLVLTDDLGFLPWVQSNPVLHKTPKLTTKYHMESEIHESLSILESGFRFDSADLARFTKLLREQKDVVLTGCGSAYHACLYGQSVLAKRGIAGRVIIASEGDIYLPTISQQSLIVAVSQSGESIDTLQFVEKCTARGAQVVCITNVPYSSLDRASVGHLYLNVGVEVAVASTKAYVYMLMAFTTIASSTQPISYGLLQTALKKLYSKSSKQRVYNLAKKLLALNHLYVLGSGSLYGLALETALKFKEIGYLHAEAMVTGELKHGPLALVEKGVVCMIYQSEKSDTTVAEISARGGTAIPIMLPDLGDFTAIYGACYAHLLSFYFATLRGHNPDRPRNLAKSVTVK